MFFLLNENRIVEGLPDSAVLCRKFIDVAGSREFYLTWRGLNLRQVSIYPAQSKGRAQDERIARLEIDGTPESVLRICQRWAIPQEWTIADYRARSD